MCQARLWNEAGAHCWVQLGPDPWISSLGDSGPWFTHLKDLKAETTAYYLKPHWKFWGVLHCLTSLTWFIHTFNPLSAKPQTQLASIRKKAIDTRVWRGRGTDAALHSWTTVTSLLGGSAETVGPRHTLCQLWVNRGSSPANQKSSGTKTKKAWCCLPSGISFKQTLDQISSNRHKQEPSSQKLWAVRPLCSLHKSPRPSNSKCICTTVLGRQTSLRGGTLSLHLSRLLPSLLPDFFINALIKAVSSVFWLQKKNRSFIM